MDLKQLKAAGGLVSDRPTPVKKTWETPGGESLEIDFFVLRQSFGQAERLYLSTTEERKDRSRTSELISEVIRLGKDGSEKMSYEDAYKLEPSLARVFLDAITETQVASAKKEKASSVKKSGTN